MMNTAQERADSMLTPEAAALVETYFSRVHGALLVAAAGECEEAVDDLRTHVLEALAGSAGTSDDVTRILAELGTPEALAAQCADSSDELSSDDVPSHDERRTVLVGRVLGLPYDWRVPTASRVARRWWDPLNPQIVVARVFGIGWTVNYGALAVRLGLVRPDDEDVPFEQVPRRWLAAALVLPLVVTAGLIVLFALFQAGLPDQVATHYAPDGSADGFSSKGVALLLPAAVALFGVAMAAWTWVRKRPALPRVAAGALATMLAGVSIGIYGQSVAQAHGTPGLTILLSALAGAIVLPFLLLVILSRVGRAAEQRRDLKAASKKGSV